MNVQKFETTLIEKWIKSIALQGQHKNTDFTGIKSVKLNAPVLLDTEKTLI